MESGTTKIMLKILLDTIQQEAGISHPILEETRPLQYIEWGWIPSIRDFLHHIKAKITNATEGLKTYREHDCLLMDSGQLNHASRKEKILINRCRLALQVECLSDIVNAEGKQIDSAWLSLSKPKPSRSNKRWPRQEDPGHEAWLIWKNFLQRAFLNDNLELRRPLGKWTHTNATRIHRSYICESSGFLWRNIKDGVWSSHRKKTSTRRFHMFDRVGSTTKQMPDDLIPVDILQESASSIITGRVQP
jgi:hypothetical protein